MMKAELTVHANPKGRQSKSKAPKRFEELSSQEYQKRSEPTSCTFPRATTR